MKKSILFYSAMMLALGFTACGDAESSIDDLNDLMPDSAELAATVIDVVDENLPDLTVSIPEIADTYVTNDLSGFGLAKGIMIPPDAIVSENALFTAAGEQSEIVVKCGEQGPELHVWKAAKDIEQVKTEVRGNTMNVFKAFMSEDADGVIYYAKKNVDDSDVYNFIRIVESEGETWHVKGEGHGTASLSKEDAMMLYAMAGSIK